MMLNPVLAGRTATDLGVTSLEYPSPSKCALPCKPASNEPSRAFVVCLVRFSIGLDLTYLKPDEDLRPANLKP